MNNLKKYLPPLLVLGFLLGFAVGFRSFIMLNIIEPIATIIWASWQMISSVNQNIHWTVLIICCAILAIRIVPVGNSGSSNSAYSYRHRLQSRVEYWQSLLTNAMMEKREVEYLRSNLEELLLSMDERQERRNSGEIALKGQTPLPASARDFLFPPKQKLKVPSGSYQSQLLLLTPGWFRRWVGKFIRPDNTSVDEVLKWMETTLEIKHDK
jgi:hypothetical protein